MPVADTIIRQEAPGIGAFPCEETGMAHDGMSWGFGRGRRRALLALLGTALLPVVPVNVRAAALTPTPSQPEGPFYPRSIPEDHDSDLTQVTGRSAMASGTVLYLSGHVLMRDARPAVGATVELWQCDVHGRYHHAGDDGEPRDDSFQGYGVATTDGVGRYAFKTIRPVPYAGRTPHLHVRVLRSGAAPLTTQIYVAGDSADGDFVLASSPKGVRERLTMTLAPASGREPGAFAGSFDIVMP
jgi:protocatechuate 3,4-dioxygenase beta subunit